MSLPADIQRFVPVAIAAVLAVAGLFFVSNGIGGGSSSGGSQSAQDIIEKAFSAAPQNRDAGRIKGRLTVSVAGPEAAAAGLSKPFSMTVDGIVNEARPGRQPSFDIGVGVEAGDERHSMHLIFTGRKGYLELDGRAYELPASQVSRFSAGQGTEDDSAALKTLGIDPRSWIKNPQNAGDAQVGGEPTTHVTAEIDVPRMLSDVLKAAEQSGQAQQLQELPEEAREAIRKAVKSAQFEVFVSKRDGSMRRVVATARFEAPGPTGKPLSGDMRFDLSVTEVGRGQKVVAPRTAAPFSALDQGSFSFDELGALGAPAGSNAAPRQSEPRQSEPEPSEPGSRSKPRERSRQADGQAYVACVKQALDAQALAKCQPLLP